MLVTTRSQTKKLASLTKEPKIVTSTEEPKIVTSTEEPKIAPSTEEPKIVTSTEEPKISISNFILKIRYLFSKINDDDKSAKEKILLTRSLYNLINKDIWNILKIAPIGKWIKFIHASVDRIPSVKNDIYMMKLIKKYDDDFVNEVMKTLNESNRILNNIIEFYNSVCLDNKDELIIFDI